MDTLGKMLKGEKKEMIYLVSYPKSGNTWLRFILGHYLNGGPVNFSNYHKVIPDVHRNPEDIPRVSTNPVFIKSHLNFQSNYKKVIYIIRNGKDVSVSYYHHLLGKNRIPSDVDFKDFFWNYFLPGKVYFGDWGAHVNSWLNKRSNIVFVRYEDLIGSPTTEVEKILRFSGLTPSPAKVTQAISASSLENMRADEVVNRQNSLEHKDVARPDFVFVRKGTTGEWQSYYDDEMTNAFEKKYGELIKRLGYE